MKLRFRIISVVLILVLFPAMVIPASADEVTSDGIIELLDYDYFNNYENLNSFHFNGSSEVFTIDVPFTGTYYYVDIVMSYNSHSVSMPELSYSYSNQWVSISGFIPGVVIAPGIVRYYGAIQGYEYPQISFQFNSSTSSVTTYCSIQSCRIFKSVPTFVDLDSYSVGSWNGQIFDFESLADGNRGYSVFNDDFSDPNAGHNFQISTVPVNALDYDFVDIIFRLTLEAVKSVSCFFHDSGVSIPMEVNYLNSGSDPTITFVHCRLDLTGVNKASIGSDYPLIKITGETGFGYNAVEVDSCSGTVIGAGENPDLYWYSKILSAISTLGSNISSWISAQTTSIGNFFTTNFSNLNSWISSQTSSIGNFFTSNFNNLAGWIYNMQSSITGWLSNVRDSVVTWGTNIVSTVSTWGQNIITAINPDPDAGEDAKDQGVEKGQEIGNLNDQMNSMTKPDLSDSGDISSIISPGDLSNYTSFLTTILNAPYISQVVMLSLILSLAAYVLFGKR